MNIIYGTQLSPFVKKVIATCEIKQIQYNIEPVIPINQTKEFMSISHLGKIPAFKDDQISLYDSSVICDYLDRKYPQNSIYPSDLYERTLTLQFEEYADTRLAEHLGKGLVYEKIIKPKFLNQAADEHIIYNTISNELPTELLYLESNIKDNFLINNQITIADIAIAALFLNATYAEFRVDQNKFPKLANMLSSIWSTRYFQTLIKADQQSLGLDLIETN
ncbi:glutathione S-transferase family protein [Cysteiniphilum sp. 6C5]|uniref:glutathione S-transferase family protein n=1 Tax=unclassified Cysteiniphilum TaxID=2610889 RepID=UPI003F861659